MVSLIPTADVETEDHLDGTLLDGLTDSPLNLSLPDADSDDELLQENYQYAAVVDFVLGQFNRSEQSRYSDEQRWLECYRNFRGLYGHDVQFTDTEKSRAFIKVTKTKVLAAYAQIIDVLFSTNKFPIGIQPSKNAFGVEDQVHFDPKAPPQPDTSKVRRNKLNYGTFNDRLEPLREHIQIGPGTTPTSATYEPAVEAAREMEEKIHDQLQEAGADKSIRAFAHELCLLGSAVFKGPFVINKEYAKWNKEGTYSPEYARIPDVSHVSVWDSYPDPEARGNDDLEFFIQRRKMSRAQIRSLKKDPSFRGEVIEAAIAEGPNWTKKHWEDVLEDNKVQTISNRWEVLEYWGIIDKDIVLDEEMDLLDSDLKEQLKDVQDVQVNIFVCNNRVLRFVINPFKPARIPYFVVPYEINPYSFFGVGVAENMLDTQMIMNGFLRMAIDNGALSSNLVFEIDEEALVPGQNTKIYPGKVFRRQSGAQGQAIHSHKFANVTQECLMIFDKARQLSDEATGMPSYSHGQSGITGVGRTASGMSMLMGAAALNIKAVVKNIDDYLLSPLGTALFNFNMQFNFHEKFTQGDLKVVALGTSSLMRNEVRAQKLMQFQQINLNPLAAPYLKMGYLLREQAAALDLDPDLVVNDDRAAAEQAQMMGQMSQNFAPNPGQQQPQAGGPPQVSDPTGSGNGNIGPGMAPGPQEQGFTRPNEGQ